MTQLHPDLLKATNQAASKRRASVQALKAEEIKERDPVAAAKLQEAEARRIEYEEKIAEGMQDVLDPKLAEETFRKKLGKYAEPMSAMVISCIATCIFAITAPLFGWFLMKVMAEINISYFLGESVIDAALPWCGIMLAASFVMFIGKSLAGVMIARVS